MSRAVCIYFCCCARCTADCRTKYAMMKVTKRNARDFCKINIGFISAKFPTKTINITAYAAIDMSAMAAHLKFDATLPSRWAFLMYPPAMAFLAAICIRLSKSLTFKSNRYFFSSYPSSSCRCFSSNSSDSVFMRALTAPKVASKRLPKSSLNRSTSFDADLARPITRSDSLDNFSRPASSNFNRCSTVFIFALSPTGE